MNDDLPTEFDIIIVGTGLSESIVAAAASRIGKKVLHVDEKEYYGDLWASFNLDGFQKFIEKCDSKNKVAGEVSDDVVLENGETLIPTNNNYFIQNISEEWFIPKEETSISDALQKAKITQTETEITSEDHEEVIEPPKPIINATWTQEKILRDYRKFNIDIAPKLLYSKGPLVDLLITSNIARYAEFRNISRVLTWMNGELQEVPCSRADVFATKQVSVVEKRMLMKLLNDVLNPEKEWSEETGTFEESLRKYKLSENVIHYVLYTMAGGTKEMGFDEGLQRMKKFLKSLGVYGNSPFLWAMYGSGEIPQCFCRLCAVFGGTYCLNRPITGIIMENDCCKGIRIGKQDIKAPVVIMGISKAPKRYLPKETFRKVSHAVFIIDKSVKDSDKENLTYIRFPPIDNKSPCNIIELGPSTSACPNNLYILHLYTSQSENPKVDLAPYISKLLNTNIVLPSCSQSTQTNSLDESTQACSSPQALWGFYYTSSDLSNISLEENLPKNLYLCAGPDYEIDYAFGVEQGRKIFQQIYPDEEFLPRAPDPEEIVLEGEDVLEPHQVTMEGDAVDQGETEEIGEEAIIEEKISPAEEVVEH